MRRRDFVRIMTASGAVAGATGVEAAPALDDSVAALQAAMTAGRTSSQALVAAYSARIRAVDRAGPKLNAVIETNPEARAFAIASDAERRAGRLRGPLHGIPILIKDNIATADRMSTSAGSLALAGIAPPRDSAVAARLREAGAIILGKTNLSEWANIRSTRSTSGWSARGGLTRNPYALDRNCSGSSSGSGAAMAAGLAALTIGTETDGSIVSPASINGLVGLKPTVGLVSRAGIVPISHTQDTAGPMTRSVADAAMLLTAIAGTDERDAATTVAGRPVAGFDYAQFLDSRRLNGARLGVVRNVFGGNDRVNRVIDEALEVLKRQGAVLVDPVTLPNMDKYGDAELDVLLFELKAGLATYLADYAPTAAVKNLADVIAFNIAHADREMRWFAQELFDKAQAKGGLDDPAYLEALATCRRYSRAEGIDAVLAEHRLDALVAPTGGPAWLTDFINSDHYGASFSTPAAVAGYPHMTVPAGFVSGLPVGLSFVGPAWSEPLLIGLGYAYEQASHARRPPTFPRFIVA